MAHRFDGDIRRERKGLMMFPGGGFRKGHGNKYPFIFNKYRFAIAAGEQGRFVFFELVFFHGDGTDLHQPGQAGAVLSGMQDMIQ